jgi:hypothetical protein
VKFATTLEFHGELQTRLEIERNVEKLEHTRMFGSSKGLFIGETSYGCLCQINVRSPDLDMFKYDSCEKISADISTGKRPDVLRE